LPNNGRGVSWRFFLNKNSQGCRAGVTSIAMVNNGKSSGGVRLPLRFLHPAVCLCLLIRTGILMAEQELYGLCANGFQDVSSALFSPLFCRFTFCLHRFVTLFIPFLQWGNSLFRFGNENRCDAA
jgi:hypothetical protein